MLAGLVCMGGQEIPVVQMQARSLAENRSAIDKQPHVLNAAEMSPRETARDKKINVMCP